jgi:ferredoxin
MTKKDIKKCTGCGMCEGLSDESAIEICPFNALSKDENKKEKN